MSLHAVNATDEELATAMLRYLTRGPGWETPFRVGREVWLSTRAETAGEFAGRFPACMDKGRSNKKKGKNI